jgi:hypothetical protein
LLGMVRDHLGRFSSSERGSGGCGGFAWSSLIVGEAEGASGDGVVEGVLQVLRLCLGYVVVLR